MTLEASSSVFLIGNRDLGVVARLFREAGAEVRELNAEGPTVAGAVREIQRAMIDEKAARLVVVGGDGMVHAGVNALAPLAAGGFDVSLGVVPLGTGNDFARALRLPLDDPSAAVRRALAPARKIDLLHTGDRWIATVATCGFAARVNERANRLRFPRGASKYTLATLLLVPRFAGDELRVLPTNSDTDVDAVARCRPDESITSVHTIVAIANTGWFGGGMHVAPYARPEDGFLDIVQVGRLRRLELLRYLPTIFSGAHVKHPATTLSVAKSVRIEGATSMELWGDGEYVCPLPVIVSLMPSALAVAGV